jgi:hypothetical protein
MALRNVAALSPAAVGADAPEGSEGEENSMPCIMAFLKNADFRKREKALAER